MPPIPSHDRNSPRDLHLVPMSERHIKYWQKWSQTPHVKEVWFIKGYEDPDCIVDKIKGNGYDVPWIICLSERPIGYLVYCDLYAYNQYFSEAKELFKNVGPQTFCLDLFIGEKDCLGKGYGTAALEQALEKLFLHENAAIVFIDPAITNKRAINCYKKCGFTPVKKVHDGVTQCLILKMTKRTFLRRKI